MSPTRAKYIQIASEALIPVLGLVFWGWGLYFILLFYFIDLSADVVITTLKSRKIGQSKGTKAGATPLLSVFLFILAISVIHIGVWFIQPGIDFFNEIKEFWTYKELGVQQGYLLVPLVWLIAYQQYKMEFVRQKKYGVLTIEKLWKDKSMAYGVICLAAGLSIVVSLIITFQDWVYVTAIVAGSATYQLLKN